MLGMLSPASRGALMTASIFLYVFMGLIAGYHSGRLYKTMKGKEWKRAAFLVSYRIQTVLKEKSFTIDILLDIHLRRLSCTLVSWQQLDFFSIVSFGANIVVVPCPLSRC